jgi:hypothetical protein
MKIILTVFCIVCATCAHADTVSIRNNILTLGVDTDHGGAISYLVDNNDPTLNLINCHDQGREVQQSYYAGPDPYKGAQWSGGPWPWNPISSGDAFGHSSSIISLNNTASSIYVKARPLQWALDNVPCNCTFETYITLDADGAFVRNRLINFREDETDYGGRDQELPAVYTIGQLSELWTYTGDAPWTGGALTQVSYPVPGPPWQGFTASEHWAAFTDGIPQHYGVGVYHHNISTFLGGFHGTQGQGGSTDDDTGYIAPVGVRDIVHDDEFVWCYHLAIGYLDTIRGYFSARRSTACSFPEV